MAVKKRRGAEIVKFILGLGWIDVKTKLNNKTALDFAIDTNQLEIIDLLSDTIE